MLEATRDHFHRKLEGFGEHAEQITRWIMLNVIDNKWKDHLYDLDHLKASITYRGWGQKDPLVEYKKEAYDMFVDLMGDLRGTLTNHFFRAQIAPPSGQPSNAFRGARIGAPGGPVHRGGVTSGQRPAVDRTTGVSSRARADAGANAGVGVPAGGVAQRRDLVTNRGESQPRAQQARATKEPGRNDPCPCGSGKKYKKCHGRGD